MSAAMSKRLRRKQGCDRMSGRSTAVHRTTRGVNYWTLWVAGARVGGTGVIMVSEASRLAALEQAGLVHLRAGAVTAPLFAGGGFFLAADKVQVKYEMLRAH